MRQEPIERRKTSWISVWDIWQCERQSLITGCTHSTTCCDNLTLSTVRLTLSASEDATVAWCCPSCLVILYLIQRQQHMYTITYLPYFISECRLVTASINLPHIDPLWTCPFSHEGRIERITRGAERSKVMLFPSILKSKSVLLREASIDLMSSSEVLLKLTVVFFGRSTVIWNCIFNGTRPVPLSRLFRATSPHSTCTFSTLQSSCPRQPPARPNGWALKISIKLSLTLFVSNSHVSVK